MVDASEQRAAVEEKINELIKKGTFSAIFKELGKFGITPSDTQHHINRVLFKFIPLLEQWFECKTINFNGLLSAANIVYNRVTCDKHGMANVGPMFAGFIEAVKPLATREAQQAVEKTQATDETDEKTQDIEKCAAILAKIKKIYAEAEESLRGYVDVQSVASRVENTSGDTTMERAAHEATIPSPPHQPATTIELPKRESKKPSKYKDFIIYK